MKNAAPDLSLARLLIALERELLEMTDDEILAVTAELGMKPMMKGSSALFGVTLPASYRELFEPVSGAEVEKRISRRRKDLPPS